MSIGMKQAVVEAWNEAEELHSSLSTLSDKEIVQCRKALEKRAAKIMRLLDKHVTGDDVRELLGDY